MISAIMFVILVFLITVRFSRILKIQNSLKFSSPGRYSEYHTPNINRIAYISRKCNGKHCSDSKEFHGFVVMYSRNTLKTGNMLDFIASNFVNFARSST